MTLTHERHIPICHIQPSLNAIQANHKIMKDDVKNENVKSTMKNEDHKQDSSNVCLFLK
jgi:hypothetical protein